VNQLTDCSLERSSCEKWCTTESEGKSFCVNRLSGFHCFFDFLNRRSISSTSEASGIFIPSASIWQVNMEGMRSPASIVTIPLLPTPDVLASCFCERPAFSRASANTAARIFLYASGGASTTHRYYRLISIEGMSVLGHNCPRWLHLHLFDSNCYVPICPHQLPSYSQSGTRSNRRASCYVGG